MSTYMNYVEGASVILGEDTNTDVLSARAGIFECAMELCKEEHDLFDSVLEAQFVTEAENKGEDKKGFFKTIGEFFKKVAEKIKELWTRLTTWFKAKVIEPAFINRMNALKDKKLEKLKGAKVTITASEKAAISTFSYDKFGAIVDNSGLFPKLKNNDLINSEIAASEIIDKFGEFEKSMGEFNKDLQSDTSNVTVDAYDTFILARKTFNKARLDFEIVSKCLSQLVKDCNKLAKEMNSSPEKYFYYGADKEDEKYAGGDGLKAAKALPGKLMKVSNKFSAEYMKYTALCRSVLSKCLHKSEAAKATDNDNNKEAEKVGEAVVEFENSMFLFEDAML